MQISSEEKLMLFLDGLNAGVWEYRFDTQTAWWSDKLYRMLGYFPGEIGIDRDSFHAHVLHPGDIDKANAATERLLSFNDAHKSEFRLKHKTLGYLWFESGGRILYDEKGMPESIYGTMVNIHDRKMLERRHALVISGVGAGIWEWDIVNNTTWWSDKFYHLLGYAPGEITADNDSFVKEILHPADREKMNAAVAAYFETKKSYYVELRFRHKSEGYIWFACSGECDFGHDGQPQIMVGSIININQRKIAEEALKYNSFFLDETGRIAQTGGWELDILQSKPSWTKATYDIHEIGYEFEPDLENAINFFHPDYREIISNAVAGAINGQPYEIELKIITAKGNEKWVKSYGEPVYDESGQIVKLRGVFKDIHEAKIYELSLNSMVGKLDTQNNQLKSFSHMLSHNLRNHAGNISLLSSMLVEAKDDPEDFDEMVSNLLKVSSRLNQTLDDMSEGLKVKENSHIQKDRLSFSAITQSVTETIQADLSRSDAVLTTDFQIEDVLFPKVYLESIITNLVSNALKYAKPDVPPVIDLSTYKNEQTGRVVFSCTDNGQGIDLDLHGDKLFNLYNVFHNHKDAHGVGLYLVRLQIESQDGEIQVKSKPGKGSTFSVVF